MNNFYIYTHTYKKRLTSGDTIPQVATVIFFEASPINEKSLQAELSQFYEQHTQTDSVIVITGYYAHSELKTVFQHKHEDTFKSIPEKHRNHIKKNIYLYTYDKEGVLKLANRPEYKDFSNHDSLKEVLNTGSVKIFVQRGGLIESEGSSHHYVFPSGKHCNKFLRTGNVLLHTSEIYFLAFQLLPYLKKGNYTQIYCDTSSINTLAFALQDIRRRLIGDDHLLIPIESFTSYDGIYKGNAKHMGNSLILISASTSGNILTKIVEKHPLVKKENMVIIYFLGNQSSYLENKDQILCDLAKKSEDGPGITFYDTYSVKDCIYCRSGSFPVEIAGDVFLLDKPKVNRVIVNRTDAPKNLSDFVKEFLADGAMDNNFFKASYKDHSPPELKYEIYFNISSVIQQIANKTTNFRKFQEKLFDHINQYIPSQTKFLVHLPDEGSKLLAELILKRLTGNFNAAALPKVIAQADISEIQKDTVGSIVVVASCISNGKNLLYLSRAFRNHDQIRLVYFTAITRMSNKSAYQFLKSNLSQGKYGKESNSFIEIDNIFCVNEVKNTSWLREWNFLKALREFAEEKGFELAHALTAVEARLSVIENAMSNEIKGLTDNLFYPPLTKEKLKLNKGFAFFQFDDYHERVTQADVYFTILIVLHNLRNSEKLDQCLKQSEYVRNLLDPGNFNRYNDGVIQASILRAARTEELAYKIEADASDTMRGILETMIKYNGFDQGDALVEFLYALATEKMTLKHDHLTGLCNTLEEILNPEVPAEQFPILLSYYIRNEVLQPPKDLNSEIKRLKEENKDLRGQLASKT